MQTLVLGLIGFSIAAAALLLAALAWIQRNVDLPRGTRTAGALLLVTLAALQFAHGDALLHGTPLLERRTYLVLLFGAAPAFFLFFRGALRAPALQRWQLLLLGAPMFVVPVAAGTLLSPRWAVSLAFALGTAYAVRLAQRVWQVRAQRKRFRLEGAVFVTMALVALLILGLGLLAPLLGDRAYVLGYAGLIGLGFWLMLFLLLRFPDIAERTAEAVRAAYAVSTLGNIDRSAALARLQQRMDVDHLYTDPALSLATLARAVDLTAHQLSELINTDIGHGVSRYLREQRVAAAMRMLKAEPRASVLSVGLAVGFTSQSNFYAAFREITGQVPGQFRRDAAAGGG